MSKINRETELGRSRIADAGFVALCLLALSLPYELDAPLFAVAGFSFTNVEVILWVTLGLGVVAWGVNRPKIPRHHLILLTLILLTFLVSALLAPTLQTNALKAALRSATGIFLALAVPAVVRTRRRAWWLVAAILVGSVLAFALGLVEVAVNTPFRWLLAFRPKISTTGPFARLTSTWDYANQAAMAAEVAVPLLVVSSQWSWVRRRRWLLLTVYCLLPILLLAAIFTLSRAALITVAAVLLLGWMWEAWRGRRLAPRWSLTLAAFVALFGASALLAPSMQMRLGSESDQAWYQREVVAPDELTMEAGGTAAATVTITNLSTRNWRSDAVFPIRVGARWLGADGTTVFKEQRWEIEGIFRPKTTRTLTLPLEAVQRDGTYFVQWDLVEQDIAWFSDLAGNRVLTEATVTGAAPSAPANPSDPAPRTIIEPLPPDPTRRTLWALGYDLWRTSPLFGIGLDNFRLRYGDLLGLETFNERLTANNWYIETVVSLGIIGGAVFFGWVGVMLWAFARKTGDDPLRLGLALAFIAFLIHGLLDYFLLFNATGLLFWLLVGLWLTTEHQTSCKLNAPTIGTTPQTFSNAPPP